MRRSRSIGEAGLPMLLKAPFPSVERGTGDLKVAAGLGYMAMFAFRVLQDPEPARPRSSLVLLSSYCSPLLMALR